MDTNKFMAEKGLMLYDAVSLNRYDDETLGWFYPVYVNKALHDLLMPKAAWRIEDQNAIIQAQENRRVAILKWNAEFLAIIKNSRSQ